MVASAAALFRRQGYAATSWREVIRHSATPWGSQAHYFPDGKEQLGVDALRLAGGHYEQLLRSALDHAAHPADAIAAWSSVAAAELERSGWADGCPVATVALETAASSDRLADACDDAFQSWRRALADAFRAVEPAEPGLDEAAADQLATLVLAAIEGALLLSRAARDPAPLHDVGAELAQLVRERVA
jgi:TetR/AcrR family transcriptional repressor of lmrAB and yxaGH operons